MTSQTLKALTAYEKTEHTELIEDVCERCGFPIEDHGPLSQKCPLIINGISLGYKDYSFYKKLLTKIE